MKMTLARAFDAVDPDGPQQPVLRGMEHGSCTEASISPYVEPGESMPWAGHRRFDAAGMRQRRK